MIVSMGFSERQADEALYQANGDLEYAVNNLSTGNVPQP